MKLKKILTAIAATAVMTSLFAIGASAAGEITNVDYNAGTGKVTFTLPAYKAEQKTLLVVKAKDDGSIVIADQYIMQIDQNSTGWTEAQLALNLEAGTKFQIYAGGDGNLYTSNVYEVTAGEEEKTVLVGEVDGTPGITGSDAAQIALYAVSNPASKVKAGEDSYYAASYADGRGGVTGSDAAQVALYAVGSPSANVLIGTEVKIGSIAEPTE